MVSESGSLACADDMLGVMACPLVMTVMLLLGDDLFTMTAAGWEDELLDDDEMVEEGLPNLLIPDEEDVVDGCGEVETEFDEVLMDVTVVDLSTLGRGVVLTDTRVEAGPPNEDWTLVLTLILAISSTSRPLASSRTAILCCCMWTSLSLSSSLRF